MSATPDSTLANPEQRIADLERQLAERTAERDEAVAQQTATAEVLGVINSSPGNLTPVFESILEKAHALCGVAYGSLQLYDGTMFRAVAVHGLPEALASRLREGYVPPGDSARPLTEGADFVHFPDMAEHAVDDPRNSAVVDAGIRTLLWVPLRKDGKLLGRISAARQEVRPFSDKEIALLQGFAAQAVIAMENARLLNELREALEQQTAMSDVLRIISRSPGKVQPVFDSILENATRLCVARFGYLALREEGAFRLLSERNLPPAFAAYLRANDPLPFVPGGRVDNMVVTKQAVHLSDLLNDTATKPLEEVRAAGMAQRRALVELGGAKTMLWVPMVKDDKVVGMIAIFRTEVEAFEEHQIELVRNFSDQAVIAMENARLLGELRERTDQVAELNRGLEARVAEQVEELGRIGRLKRFLAPQLAELIVSQGDEKFLESHRCEIVVAFCDLRGYTAFAEAAEPEEVLDFLREYHRALGPLVSQFEGTLDQFSGDGIMVFFNDPVPIPDPAERAVKMAVAMREAASTLIAAWRERGRQLGFGVGVAQGYATLGQIGSVRRPALDRLARAHRQLLQHQPGRHPRAGRSGSAHPVCRLHAGRAGRADPASLEQQPLLHRQPAAQLPARRRSCGAGRSVVQPEGYRSAVNLGACPVR